MHPLDEVGKMHKCLAADMVRSPRSQNVPTAATAVTASASVAAAVPGRSIAVAGQIAAAVVVAPGRSNTVDGQVAVAAVADVVAAR